MTTARQTTKTATQRARSRFQVTVEFHVVLRVVSLDLGFHVVIGVGRLNVQQDGFIRQLHFTTHTQRQMQSSFLLDVVVRLCPVIVNSICIPTSCIFHIAKTGLLRCCLITFPSSTARFLNSAVAWNNSLSISLSAEDMASSPSPNRECSNSLTPPWILLSFLQVALQCPDESTFPRVPLRVRVESVLPTLRVPFFQHKWWSWPTSSFWRKRSFWGWRCLVF